MVRDDVENKVANEGCKPEWNELLHMLERRLQRYSSVMTKSWLFVMTEPHEHALEQSESAVGIAVTVILHRPFHLV